MIGRNYDMSKNVLVTGATNGTGFAIASRFAREGYNVFAGSRDEKRAADAAAEISAKYGVKAYGCGMKVYDEENVKKIFGDIRSKGMLLDAVVLNAANLGIGQDTLSVPAADFMEVIQTNIGWNFMIARQAALQMKEKGGGAIVFITSNTAYRAIPSRCGYCTSKGGILAMSRALAIDLGQYGIRSNCVLPGMIKTDRWLSNYNNCRHAPSNNTPIGDIAEFDDIANAAWYLGSSESRNTTGAELVVDGGNSAQLYPCNPNFGG